MGPTDKGWVGWHRTHDAVGMCGRHHGGREPGVGSPRVAWWKPWVAWHPRHLPLCMVTQHVDCIVQSLLHPRLLRGNITGRVKTGHGDGEQGGVQAIQTSAQTSN